MPSPAAMASSADRDRDNTSIASDATSQLTEYSTRMCERRSEVSTSAIKSTLIPVVKFKRRSIRYASLAKTRKPQDVHEHAQQHMNYIVNGFHRRDGGLACLARMKTAGLLGKPERFPLQHDQGLDLRIFQWEALAEHLQRIPVHADEPGGGVAHILAQDGTQNHAEKVNPQ